MKSPPEKVCVPGCECNTVMLFHLFGKNIPAHLPQPPPHPRPPLPPSRRLRGRQKNKEGFKMSCMLIGMPFECEGKGGHKKKNETETEWTLCR